MFPKMTKKQILPPSPQANDVAHLLLQRLDLLPGPIGQAPQSQRRRPGRWPGLCDDVALSQPPEVIRRPAQALRDALKRLGDHRGPEEELAGLQQRKQPVALRLQHLCGLDLGPGMSQP